MTQNGTITIIGGGLAGCEAAWQLLKRDYHVILYEMKPRHFSPAHRTVHLAELVCSNSFRAARIDHAAGLLKEEMRELDSLIMRAADATTVSAGRALAVDREQFSRRVESELQGFGPAFQLIREEMRVVPPGRPLIIATGPLTSDPFAQALKELLGEDYLYFYDAISPIIDGESIDYSRGFWASRYEDGADYFNFPLDEGEYHTFWQALTTADEMPFHPFEENKFFEGCLPIEVIAKRGKDTLRFGPMKPVGLIDPHTDRRPYAVLQLRRENREGTMLNMVGFQTKLRWPEQKRVFSLIPGLERAEYVRYGSMHRNTFINGPALLQSSLELRTGSGIFLAGQITGVEGYIESAAMGLIAGLSVACFIRGVTFESPPPTTALGALIRHITTPAAHEFQPMNVNFGLFLPLEIKVPRRERGHHYATRALAGLREWNHGFLAALS